MYISMNTKATVLSDLIRALTILPIMDKYMLIVLYTGGIFGSLLNIATLLQKKFRKNPCSLYFLFASITDFMIMNGVLVMDAMRYWNSSLFTYMNSTIIWCKLGKHLVFLLPCLSSTFIALASIDRFCTSSDRPQLRKLSQLKVSRIIISCVIFVWILFSLHVLILYDIMPSTTTQLQGCRSPPQLFLFILIADGYIFSIYNGAIVPLLLSIFGFLIYRNVRMSHRRIAPIPDRNSNRTNTLPAHPPLNRHNLHLITMVLVQSSLTVILNIPYMTIYLNSFYNNVPTDHLLLLVYAIFVYIGRWFWFSNYVKTFYLNSLSSHVFRSALKQQFTHCNRQSRARFLPRTAT